MTSKISAPDKSQWRSRYLVQRSAPIELEYHFESFIRHGHPIQQVAMIVCWDFQTTPDKHPGLSMKAEWLYHYETDDGACPVLVLSELPGIAEIDHL